MRIKSVRIENLRAFVDETIELDKYTTFVGGNGSGKSTVLCALNILFRETAESPLNLLQLGEEDFHGKDTSKPVRVTVTFGDLSKEAQEDLSDYYRQGELVVTAEAKFDSDKNYATVVQKGQRRVIKALAPFFEADKAGVKVDELRQIYSRLREQFPELPAETTKDKMKGALRAYDEAHPDLAELVESEDEFYGFSKGKNRLARHVQWVYVPAVKDPSEEQAEAKETGLGKLLARTVRARINFAEALKQIRDVAKTSYDGMLQSQQSALDDLSRTLSQRLADWTHPGAKLAVRWEQEPEKSVRIEEPVAWIHAGEGPFIGNLARMGHGLQRAYLLALLQELSRVDGDVQPTLILGIEEPELYQHPPQCRHMSKVLQDLAEGNAQVVLTTHSPLFIGSRMYEGVRLVRKDPKTSEASVASYPLGTLTTRLSAARGETQTATPQGMLAKIHQSLQPGLNEIFFAPFIVLLEGREDLAYIVTYMNLLGYADKLRAVKCHFVPADGKSAMAIPLAITTGLRIPTFAVFDADTDAPDRNGIPQKHRKDNVTLLRLVDVASPEPWPKDTFWGDRVVMWRTELRKEIEADFDPREYGALRAEVELAFGLVGGLEKNPLFIADLLDKAWNKGVKSPQLERLCKGILSFCGIATEGANASVAVTKPQEKPTV